MKSKFNFGPAVLVTAAFIGPGTVVVCTKSGVDFGYSLLWALLFSTLTTYFLQEMAARLGLVTGQGLADNIRTQIKQPILKWLFLILILVAVVVGNSAYEAGNISGGALGLNYFFNSDVNENRSISSILIHLVIGIFAMIVLWIGKYKLLERLLVVMVLLMSIIFVITAILVGPALLPLLRGLFVPEVHADNIFTVIALIGTTVVPYNLFLHASIVRQKWTSAADLSASKRDTLLAVLVGGLISMAIVITATGAQVHDVNSLKDLSTGLESVLGPSAQLLLALGLFCAGLTSSITAPLAAGYVMKEIFNWSGGMKSLKFRGVSIGIIILGLLFSTLDFKPIQIIQAAQVANGLLLPIIAASLIIAINKTSIMGQYKNSKIQNVISLIILSVTLILGAKILFGVFK